MDLVVVDDADDLILDPLRAAATKYIEPIPFAEFNYQVNELMISDGLQMLTFADVEPEVVQRWVIFTQTCMRIYESEDMEMAKPNEPLVQIPLNAINGIVSDVTDFDPEVVNLTSDAHHVTFQAGMFLVKLEPDFLRLYLSEHWSPSGISERVLYGD